MEEAKRKEVRQWLIKSQRDLGSARRLMEGDETYLDVAVYHCQQAAEKAIKAYLAYRNTTFEKTHNLVALLAFCLPLDPTFEQWKEAAKILTPYATEFRYPGDVLEPERREAEQALAQAEALVNFIVRRLPEEVRP
ncbi:HEPN domain-containing protein [Methanothrix sp.]|uniref:HEPN domain-containing protein n=1 Tax=Methanothrix sp. TaxID=90426 RepID=UPI003C73233C